MKVKFAARLLPILIGILLLSTLSVPGVQAATKQYKVTASHTMPSTYNCGSVCYAWTGWNGNQYGGQGRFYTTGASMVFHSTPGSLVREIGYLTQNNGLESGPRIYVGEDVSTAGVGFCGSKHPTSQAAYFFFKAVDSSNGTSYLDCQAMPSGDADGEIITQSGRYVSNGGGWLEQIWGPTGDHFVSYIPYSDVNNQGYWVDQMLQETILDAAVTGHEVWGAYDEEFAFYAYNNGNLYWQGRPVDYLSNSEGQNYPPQMGWLHAPSTTYPGGQAISCDYEFLSGGFCTFNG